MMGRDDDEARARERSAPRLPVAPSMGPALETVNAPIDRANVDGRVLGMVTESDLLAKIVAWADLLR